MATIGRRHVRDPKHAVVHTRVDGLLQSARSIRDRYVVRERVVDYSEHTASVGPKVVLLTDPRCANSPFAGTEVASLARLGELFAVPPTAVAVGALTAWPDTKDPDTVQWHRV